MEAQSAGTFSDLGVMSDAILSRIITILVQDDRVAAAWLTGSIGRGEDDAWSDLDLHLAIADASFDAWWQARETLYHEINTPLLVQQPKPSNAQECAHFQLVYFPGPVEVDWNVGPASMATRPPTSRMLISHQDIPITQPRSLNADERRERLQHSTDFFWSMAPIAVKYAGRGATTAAVDQIDLLAMGLTTIWQVLRHPISIARIP